MDETGGKAIGIDIGGSRIKAAIVDPRKGETTTKRNKIDPPRPATPEAILEVCARAVEPFGDIPVAGVGFPGVIRDGIVHTAHNLADEWIGFDLEGRLGERLGRPVAALNDADAAGVAEVRFGAGKEVGGTVILLTIGTGLGSALFTDGRLVRNSELGRLWFGGKVEAEEYVSETAWEKEKLSEKTWAARMEEVLAAIETLFWPTRIILGGGGAKGFDSFAKRIKTRCDLVHADAKNKAGIIGAAAWAVERSNRATHPS